MHVEKIAIAGFRCFGPDPTVMNFNSGLTAIVGPNALGKTEVLHALMQSAGVQTLSIV